MAPLTCKKNQLKVWDLSAILKTIGKSDLLSKVKPQPDPKQHLRAGKAGSKVELELKLESEIVGCKQVVGCNFANTMEKEVHSQVSPKLTLQKSLAFQMF